MKYEPQTKNVPTENFMFDRLRVQKPKTVKAKLDNLSHDSPPEEKAMLEWMLRQGAYPKWRYDVTKAIEGRVNIHGEANVFGIPSPNNFSPPPTENNLSLDEILSVTHNDSLSSLLDVKKPDNYLPVPSVEDLTKSFENNFYFLPEQSIFVVQQAISLNRPLLVGGPVGVGKSELAKQIALAMKFDIENPYQYDKLFCTPETDIKEAIYDWNDAKRLSDLQLLNSAITSMGNRVSDNALKELYHQVAAESYGSRYLMIRKLLKACVIPHRTVTLIDEVDKTFPTFDNQLLDIVSTFRFEIPEFGPVGRTADNIQSDQDNPFFVLTINDAANGGRDLSDMLISRCTPLFMNYLPSSLEAKIISKKCGIDIDSAGRIADFFYKMRTGHKLRKPPSTREVIVTALALVKFKFDPTEQNLLKLNCHWIKNRLDMEKICSTYKV